ncbi:MAG: hypothetical protein ACI32E_07285 [Bacilli bacterium]
MIVFQILVVVGSILLFTISLILNRNTKVKGEETMEKPDLPENCLTCTNKTCLESLERYKNDQARQKKIENCKKGENDNEE